MNWFTKFMSEDTPTLAQINRKHAIQLAIRLGEEMRDLKKRLDKLEKKVNET